MLFLELGLTALVSFAWGMVYEIWVEKRRQVKAQAKLSLVQKQVFNTGAGKAAHRDLVRKLDTFSKGVTKRQSEHLEMFAAAYLKLTDVPPDQAELVQEMHGVDKITWRFVKRNDLH